MTMQATVRNIQGGTLSKASNQWSTRPADERYETLDSLLAATLDHKKRSMVGEVNLRDLRMVDGGGYPAVVGPSGVAVRPNHWAFGQLCQRAQAPAGYIRSLPVGLAIDCVRTGLEAANESAEARLLIRAPDARNTGTHAELCALTSPKYQRVWNHEVAQALVDLRERQPAWQFPEPFRKVGGQVANPWGPTGKQVPVAYASDHDMFVFLCDYEHGVEVNGNMLARGFFVENSEVGDAAFRVTMFLFDFVCSNILVWGAKNVVEVKMNHVGSIRDRVLRSGSQVLKALAAYGESSAFEQKQTILHAQQMKLGDTNEDVLRKLFGNKALGIAKKDIEAAQVVAAENPRYGDPRTVWAMANGLTEVSQRSPYADARIKLDRAAGEVLSFAF
jgi:Domain of unknown function (DUF932)